MNRSLIITGVGIVAFVCGLCNLPPATPETYTDGFILNRTTLSEDYTSIVIHNKMFYLVCIGGVISIVGLVLIYKDYRKSEVFPLEIFVLKGILKKPSINM